MTGAYPSLIPIGVDGGKKFYNIDTNGKCYKTFSKVILIPIDVTSVKSAINNAATGVPYNEKKL